MQIIDEIKGVIKKHKLDDWFADYPWLTGSLGDPNAPVWFIGENPSLSAVEAIDRKSSVKSENLQWKARPGDRLLREAITEAGLKTGDPESNDGWRCFITNAVKEPEIVGERNQKKRDVLYRERQMDRWLPVFQNQIDAGNPQVLIALGNETYKIIQYMKRQGLNGPHVEKIYHYSYVMQRPEAKTRKKPGHPDRIFAFKSSVKTIAERYEA